ncbi:MAG TPA: 3-deoxy-D-manno-octulosonic acid transferase, partial [Thermoanaerobaculia bacterium]|nr:3-deoxy-D-manno-octulosonic acid transferase [Thermoanaerobaculia bacterium]
MFLYRVLSVLALIAYSPYALVRSALGRRRLGDIRGRLGLAPYPDLDGGIWVHAVSVGEVGAACNLLAALSRKLPGARLGLSVTTAAGLEAARRVAGQSIAVFSFPLDLAGPVEKALSAVRPGLIVLTETELWPLVLERARARGVPVALVNGRISDRSFRRYLLLRGWFRRVLGNVSLFAMQTEEDARRIERLGARPERILVTGNIKYDLAPAPPFADAARLSSAAAGRPILVAASTGEGEEQMVLEAWKGLDPRPLLVLAPRRPERFDGVARLIESSGFTVVRRSSPDPAATNHKSLVYLLDSIGELASLYGEAFLAFLGGSLVATGGHNPIEAWAQGVAVLVGPNTGNFREITRAGQRLGILECVADTRELGRAFDRAVKDPAAASARGDRARRFVAESRGAAASTADSVAGLLRS